MALFMRLNEMLGQNTWPPAAVRESWAEVELNRAFLTSHDTRIRQEASVRWQDRYMVSPVPRMISRASANMLFGEVPEFAAASEADQANLDRIVTDQALEQELHRAAVVCSAEREIWGRIVVMPGLVDVPVIEFVSLDRVIPHFSGRFVQGATFVTTWETGASERMRLLETYLPGVVQNELYRGTRNQLGTQVKLASFEETAALPDQTLTGVDWPLVAFIPNTVDCDPTRGYSDYQGLRDRFLAMNEAGTIGQANMLLTGRKRALVDGEYLQGGRLPVGDDLFIRNSRHQGDGMDAKPLQLIDYTFEADQTVKWIEHMLDTTLTFAGLSPQSVGRAIDGGAVSGTALKLKMAHSLMEAAGKGRHFDRGVRRLLRAAQIIDGRPTTEGGFGRSYAMRDAEPAITRGDGLPRDDMEAAQQVALMVGADAISLEERVAFLHPDWTQDQIDEELDHLRAEQSLAVPPIAAPA